MYDHEVYSKWQLIPYNFCAYQYLKIEARTKVTSHFLRSTRICARCRVDRLTVNSRMSFVWFGCVPAVVAPRLYWESLVLIYGVAGHSAYRMLLHCALRIVPWMPFFATLCV